MLNGQRPFFVPRLYSRAIVQNHRRTSRVRAREKNYSLSKIIVTCTYRRTNVTLLKFLRLNDLSFNLSPRPKFELINTNLLFVYSRNVKTFGLTVSVFADFRYYIRKKRSLKKIEDEILSPTYNVNDRINKQQDEVRLQVAERTFFVFVFSAANNFAIAVRQIRNENKNLARYRVDIYARARAVKG